MRTVTVALLALLFAAASLASITGTVVDDNGKPISGATVRAWAAESTRAFRQRLLSAQPESEPFATVTTNDAGAFSIEAKGNLAVDLRFDKAERRTAVLDAVDGDEPLMVMLRPAPRRKLRVEAGGKPVANALVVFSARLLARTDAAGETPMAIDENNPWVIHPDYAIARATAGASPVVKLEKGIALRGRVLNAKGAGVKADLFINGFPAGASGDDGAFTIAHAPANWNGLRAVAGREAALVPRSKAASIDVRLLPAAVVSGTLRDDAGGRGVAGGRVTLRQQQFTNDTDGFETVVSDAKGNFAFEAMPPRGYLLFASHPEYSFVQTPVALGDYANRIVLARPLARLRGRVTDEARKPVAGALMNAFPSSVRSEALTDEGGNFTLRAASLENQLVTVTAAKRGYASGSSSLRRIKPGDVVSDIAITLPMGFPLQVRVVDGKKQPVANASVFVSSEDETGRGVFATCEDPWQDNCRTTDAKGQVNLRAVEGTYTVSVQSAVGDGTVAPKRLAGQQITAKTSPLIVQVEYGVAVSGKVVYPDGTPVADVSVDIRGGMGTAMGFRPQPSPDGTFNITGLASGKYTLTAITSDGRMTTPSVDVTAPAANVTLTMPRGGRIEGRVVERGTLRPVTDFAATPTRGSGPMMMFRPNPDRETHSEDGAFTIDNVPAGTTTLRVVARGYVPATRSDIQVEEGRTVTGIEVQLERGAKLSGRVTAEGKPVAGVGVRMLSVNTPVAGPNVGTTDADGNYTIDGLAAGEPAFEFRKQGYVSKRQNVEISAAKEARLDVDLERGRDLRGRVVDKSGAAIEGATVSAFPSGMGGENIQSITSADGSFTLEGLGESRYNVSARKSGYVTANEREVVVPPSSPLVLTLDRGGAVSGRVTGLTPSELPMCRVTINGQGSYASGQVDTNGAFTIHGVPDGQLTAQAVLASPSDRRSRPKTIVVENGSAAPIEINFEEGFTVRGRVTFNGVPASNGYINFRPHEGGQAGVSGRVAGGAYELTGFAAGEYDVMLSSAEGGFRGKYTVTGSGTFDIDVRGATLHGRVVDADSSAPVADASISVMGKSATAFSNSTSDSDGRFSVPTLLDGEYTLSVHRETYSPSTQTVLVTNGVVPEVEVRLEGGTAVTIIVVDSITGAALNNANITLDVAGKRNVGGIARGEDGVRVWLRPGRYSATANSFGYGSASEEFSVPGPTVRIALSRTGSLVVLAKSAGMARLRGAIGTRPVPFSEGFNNPINFPAGAYTLEVLDATRKTVLKSLPVVIVSGEKTTVSVD